MTSNLWVRRIRRWLSRPGAPRRRPERRTAPPCLEALEDRLTPSATFNPTVNTDGVSFNGQVNTLRDAILAANRDTGTGTDTIQLQANTTYTLNINNSNGHEIVGTEGDLNITNTSHALVIQGIADVAGNPTTVIDQTVLDRVFQIVNPGVNVTFKNLIIEGGQAQENGTAGAAAGSTEADGGGILDDGGNVTLSNVILRNNSADAGAGLNANGGGVYVASGGTLTVQGSEIQADGALVAAITDASNGHNGGFASGGGIFALGQTSIANSTVSGNVVQGGNCTSGAGGNAEGGAVFAVGPTTINDSTLSGNTLTAGSSNDFGIGGNAEGGAVWLGSGQTVSLTITGSQLTGNRLAGGDGGHAGNADGGSVLTKSTTTITDSSLSNNTLNGGVGNSHVNLPTDTDVGGDAIGGGIFSLVGSNLTISASNLSGNTLNGGQGTLSDSNGGIAGDVGGEVFGGGVYANGQTAISTSVLSGNTLNGGSGHYVSGNVGGRVGGNAEGGGVYFDPLGSGATIAITASTLSGNTVTGGAGSILGSAATPGLAMGGGAFLAGAGATIVNSTIASNQAIGGQGVASNPDASGGGLFFPSTATASLTNDTVVENSAALSPSGEGASFGGGIDNAGGDVTLVNTLVAQNFASDGNGPDYFGPVGDNSRNLIGKSDGSTGFKPGQGDQLGSIANPLDPRIGALAGNGGPTQTIALLPGSPAINAGDNGAQSVTGAFDQRGPGFPRVVGGTIDIGAFEVQSPPPGSPPPSSPPPSPPPPSPPPPPAPSLFQALISLYIDGVEEEAILDLADSLSGGPAPVGALERLLALLGDPSESFDPVQANIDFNERFTGPFGPLVVQAGQRALDNALQLPPASPPGL